MAHSTVKTILTNMHLQLPRVMPGTSSGSGWSRGQVSDHQTSFSHTGSALYCGQGFLFMVEDGRVICYYALQSNLQIQCLALLDYGMSHAGDFRSGGVFTEGFYHIKATVHMR